MQDTFLPIPGFIRCCPRNSAYVAVLLHTCIYIPHLLFKNLDMYVYIPQQVSFEKHVTVGGEEEGGDGEGEREKKMKVVKKTLFQRSNLYPQKKVLTFNRYSNDFAFSVYYSHLGFLSEDEKMYAYAAPFCVTDGW